MMIFSSLILACAGLLGTFAPPALTPVAEDGFALLKTGARPLGPLLVKILRFVLNDFSQPQRPAASVAKASGAPSEPDDGLGIWLARHVSEGFLAGIVLAMAAFLGLMIWRTLHWLPQRGTESADTGRPLNRLIELLLLLCAWVADWRRSLWLYFGGSRNIGRLFAALEAWGRLGGVARRDWETPREYAGRLSLRFPRAAVDIDTIVAAFQHQVYGERKLKTGEITEPHKAWRRLRSPIHWPSRWRSLYDRPDRLS
jgi:hypothetical protein